MNGVLLSINEGRLSFHVDVMDGKLVERAAVSMSEYQHITANAKMPIDVHLMINKPQDRIDEYLNAPHHIYGKGVRCITFHVEAIPKFEAKRLLSKIQKAGIKGGVAIDLDTYVGADGIRELIEKSDVVLVMSVKAGASGRPFSIGGMHKVAQIKKINPAVRVILDGGINSENIQMIKKAGVDTVVVGKYIYSSEDRKETILNLIRLISV
jgi:ribulose-phosphate 3-epimerase